MHCIYEVECVSVKRDDLEKIIKWLNSNNIENVKTDEKLLIKFYDL